MESNVRSATPLLQIGVFVVAGLLALPWMARHGVAGLVAYLLAGAGAVWMAAWFSGPEDRLGVGERKLQILIGWPVFAALAAFRSLLGLATPAQPVRPAMATAAAADVPEVEVLVAEEAPLPAPGVQAPAVPSAPLPAPAAKTPPPAARPAPAAAGPRPHGGKPKRRSK